MSRYRPGTRWIDSTDQVWKVHPDGLLYGEFYEAKSAGVEPEWLESNYGMLMPMDGERVYVEGDVWEDKDGDEWEVLPDGMLKWSGSSEFNDKGLSPSYVDNLWGPLVLKKPAEDNYDEVAMADWEKELLEKDYLAKPMVFDLSEELAERLDRGFVNSAVATYDDALHVLLKKNADYGSKNIAESPGGALNGLRVRMWDKMARINNLMDSGAEPENESLRDSFADLMNYSAIALMVLDGKWPGSGDDGA